MFDRTAISPRLRPDPAPRLPVETLVIGKPVAEVAALLPRLFNLCRAAQGAAVRMALDLPPDGADLAAEIRRDHLLKLFVTLPGHFGLGAMRDAMAGDDWSVLKALFGTARSAPESADDVAAFLASGQGVAPLLARIDGCFGRAEAVADGLPLVTVETAQKVQAVENSTAARQARHPAMRVIEASHGRGPLWRVLGRVIDLADGLAGGLPAPVSPARGVALVPATRGLYAVSARAENGCVAAFARVTPTDHLLAPDGILDRTLATLPATKAGLAPLLLDILDPCSPMRLREVADA